MRLRPFTPLIKSLLNQTYRPLVITHHGKSCAVLIDVEDYQKLLDKVQLL
ncbi:MAG: type II toxin-antitoxin system Phd/YefM family antitoxin [Balneolaceae bacterium]|nr:MAG: type II toxin-antitoxin system Phd/YefM family antitoxin [Balneolaceae bacterium]